MYKNWLKKRLKKSKTFTEADIIKNEIKRIDSYEELKKHKEVNVMKKKDALKIILEYYYENKEIAKKDEYDYKYFQGVLCAIRYILINVYGFKQNDNRF